MSDITLLRSAFYIKNIDCIVGISRGGAIVAMILAHKIGIKEVYTVGYDSYNDKGKQKKLKRITPKLNLKGKNILLIDDIVDSGKTLERALKDLKGNKITSISLHCTNHSKVIPDFWIHNTSNWIIYPWEQ